MLGTATALAVVLSVMLSDFFDTMGTAIGLGGEMKMLDSNGRPAGIKRVLLIDSIAAAAGGAALRFVEHHVIESASGISEGGRTDWSPSS